MSQRSIRRAGERRIAREGRRQALRRRRAGLAATAAIGAAALAGPGAAQADTTFPVTNNGDHAADACDAECTLRDAINAANTTAGNDTITFDSSVTGTIRLTQGPLSITGTSESLTIQGPGRDVLEVSGDADDSNTPNAGDSRILVVTSSGAVAISGLTLTEGYANGGLGAGVFMQSGTNVTISDSAITNSLNQSSGGGGIWSSGRLALVRTTVSGNTASSGGGGVYSNGYLEIENGTISGNSGAFGGGVAVGDGTATIDGTQISTNHATNGVLGDGGGISNEGDLTVTASTISGNTATGRGAGVRSRSKYGMTIADSSVFGNSGSYGGGIAFQRNTYGGGPVDIIRTTIAGNHATAGDGGGVFFAGLAPGDRVTLQRSTVADNDATGFGGGLALAGGAGGAQRGDLQLVDSTVSGNRADVGGGLSAGDAAEQRVLSAKGSIALDNSTLAANRATTRGGGVYLGRYDTGDSTPVTTSPTVALTSTAVADNRAGGADQDADRATGSTGGGFDAAFTLVERPGDAPLHSAIAGTNMTGIDPQLGPLTLDGGTAVHRPARTSRLIDRGTAPARLRVDQRGHDRTVDAAGLPNAPRGDGTDIGAVEVDHPFVPAGPKPPGNARPVAVITANHLRAKRRKKRIVAGEASDDVRVRRVGVALVRILPSGRCRELLQQGEFSRPRECRVPPRSFLTAHGTTEWTFRLHNRLKPGRYRIYVRAIDNKGRRQVKFGKDSRHSFRVKKPKRRATS